MSRREEFNKGGGCVVRLGWVRDNFFYAYRFNPISQPNLINE